MYISKIHIYIGILKVPYSHCCILCALSQSKISFFANVRFNVTHNVAFDKKFV